MPKKKSTPKKSQPSKQKKQPVRTAGNVIPRVVRKPNNEMLVRAVCSITDPFCTHAVGGKYPDDSSVKTAAWAYRTRVVMSSDTGGNLGYLFAPNYNYQPYLVGAPASASQCSFSTYTAGAPIANTSLFRIVTWGAKITRVVAPLNASGMVHVRVLGVQDGLGLDSIDMLSYARSESFDCAVQDCKAVSITGTHTAQMPQVFYGPTATTPTNSILTWTAAGFTPITISVTGAPVSTAILEAEIWVNYELTFDESSSMGLFATPPPSANMVVTGAAAKVSSSLPAITKNGDDVGSTIRKTAAGAVAGFFGGPAAGALASMIMP